MRRRNLFFSITGFAGLILAAWYIWQRVDTHMQSRQNSNLDSHIKGRKLSNPLNSGANTKVSSLALKEQRVPPRRQVDLIQAIKGEAQYENQFIETIQSEEIRTSMRRFSDFSEYTTISGGGPNIMPTIGHRPADPMAKTRRFAKVAFYITDPGRSHHESIELIRASISENIQLRSELENKLKQFIADNPEIATPRFKDVPTGHRVINGFTESFFGTGVLGSEPDAVPPSFVGAQRAMLADTMLLGMLADREALPLLADLSQLNDVSSFGSELTEMLKNSYILNEAKLLHVEHPEYFSYVSRMQLADAMDRILSDTRDPRNAEYVAWRSQQNFHGREAITLYPPDIPASPNARSGDMQKPTGQHASTSDRTLNYSLPMHVDPLFDENQARQIIEFGRQASGRTF